MCKSPVKEWCEKGLIVRRRCSRCRCRQRSRDGVDHGEVLRLCCLLACKLGHRGSGPGSQARGSLSRECAFTFDRPRAKTNCFEEQLNFKFNPSVI